MGPPGRGRPASEIRLATLPSSPLESLSSVLEDVVVGGAAEPLATIWRDLVANPLLARGVAKDIGLNRQGSTPFSLALASGGIVPQGDDRGPTGRYWPPSGNGSVVAAGRDEADTQSDHRQPALQHRRSPPCWQRGHAERASHESPVLVMRPKGRLLRRGRAAPRLGPSVAPGGECGPFGRVRWRL